MFEFFVKCTELYPASLFLLSVRESEAQITTSVTSFCLLSVLPSVYEVSSCLLYI